jgi:hypothetical protein
VLTDLGRVQTREARIILGAAVIDDVLGLVILAVVTGSIQAANAGTALDATSVFVIIGKATAFLVGAVVLGSWLAPRLFGVASRLRVRGMLLITALGFCFTVAYLANLIELAPIVGAFAAGLILDQVHYKNFTDQGEHRLEELLRPVALFLAGAALAYYVAMPVALHFLLGYEGNIGGVQQDALPGVGNYLSFVTRFIFGFGLAFLLPVLLMLLEKAGLVTRDQLRRGRRYAIVIAFAIAAVLTPPDVVSQLLLAVPMVVLYEVSLIAIWFTERRRAKEKAEAEAA